MARPVSICLTCRIGDLFYGLRVREDHSPGLEDFCCLCIQALLGSARNSFEHAESARLGGFNGSLRRLVLHLLVFVFGNGSMIRTLHFIR